MLHLPTDADESPELECDDRGKQREAPEEVVYGQIVVLEGAKPNTERDRPEGQEETLYAGIQLGQWELHVRRVGLFEVVWMPCSYICYWNELD